MRALSLWQPWASAIIVGSKLIETRGWSTGYRGTILIHASKRKHLGELISFSCCWNWCGALAAVGLKMGGGRTLDDLLPFGALLGAAEIVDCRPTDSFTQGEIGMPRQPERENGDLYQWTERQMGDFSLGRFGFVLANIRPFETPIPFKGAQGFFQVPDELVRDQLDAAKPIEWTLPVQA